jgi:hypothetical protein
MAPPALPVPCARPNRTHELAPGDDPLVALAHVLADDTLAPTAVGVVFDGDTSELHVKPLDDHPVQVLLGFEAPAEWDAFGVVVTGRARAYPGDSSRPPRVPVGSSMVLSFLVDRSNRSVSVMHIEGQAPIVIETEAVDETVGALSDTCRRVLGLPTPPPDRSIVHLWATVWLDRVVERAAADPDARPEWDDIAALHPALAFLVVHGLPAVAHPGTVLVEAGRAFGEVASWSDLRDEYLDDAPDALPDEVLEPSLVAWMDLGMFSRCVLGRLPELADLRTIASEVLATAVYERVDDALRAWGLTP